MRGTTLAAVGWRWFGSVAALVLVLAAAPVAASADETPAACTNLQGRITSITALGPGRVAVQGVSQPGAADDPTCDAKALLYAYTGRGDMEFWYKDLVMGVSEGHPQADGAFGADLQIQMGNWAVCLEDAQRRPLDCVNVLTPAEFSSGRYRAGNPIVRGWINVHLGQAPAGGGGHGKLPECGHCI